MSVILPSVIKCDTGGQQKNGLRLITGAGALLLQQALCGNSLKNQTVWLRRIQAGFN